MNAEPTIRLRPNVALRPVQLIARVMLSGLGAAEVIEQAPNTCIETAA